MAYQYETFLSPERVLVSRTNRNLKCLNQCKSEKTKQYPWQQTIIITWEIQLSVIQRFWENRPWQPLTYKLSLSKSVGFLLICEIFFFFFSRGGLGGLGGGGGVRGSRINNNNQKALYTNQIKQKKNNLKVWLPACLRLLVK